MTKPPKAVSAYLARIGAAGGKVGGKTKGPSKRRSDAHYARLAADKKAKAAKRRKAKP